MLWDGIYHSACHVGRGEGSKGDSGTKGVIHTPSGQEVRSGVEGLCLLDKGFLKTAEVEMRKVRILEGMAGHWQWVGGALSRARDGDECKSRQSGL